MNGTLVRGGDWERFWFVCVASPSSTQSFCRQTSWIFFEKRWKQSDALLLFVLSVLFLCFLRSALLSLSDEKKNHRGEMIPFIFFFFFYSSSFPYLLWGKVFLLKTTPHTPFRSQRGCVCFGRFALLSRVFFFFCYFWLWAELCALFCSALFTRLLRTRFYHSFPLYFSPLFIQMRKHIKVFIIS